LLRPDLFTTARGHLSVVTEGNAEGQTIFAPEGRPFLGERWSSTPLVEVCLNADGEKIVDWIVEVLT
ncbi:MAG TPA: nucleoside hydrolase, partial [Modicisalibacter sp.]|nr:nucleoside hydrolase [Modicisalibacter sp.]